jgi:hypothetical protein
MRRRDDRLLVRFQAEYFDPAAKDHLWRELVDHAVDQLGADSYSIQTDLLEERIPPEAIQSRESLLAQTRARRAQRALLPLKPPRWPLDPTTRSWLREAGRWVYRTTLWKGKNWLLEPAAWSNSFTLVLGPEKWSQLQTQKPWLTSLDPAPRSEPFRKVGERVRRGWVLSRPVRWSAALTAVIVIGVGVALDQGLAGLCGPHRGSNDLCRVARQRARTGESIHRPSALSRRSEIPTTARTNPRSRRGRGAAYGVRGSIRLHPGGAGLGLAPGLLGSSGWWDDPRLLLRRNHDLVDVQVPAAAASVAPAITPST